MFAFVQMMYERVGTDHHLKHNGRLQLGLFLKARFARLKRLRGQ